MLPLLVGTATIEDSFSIFPVSSNFAIINVFEKVI